MYDKTSAMVVDAQTRMEAFRKDRNFKVNNTELVLTLPRGQIEVMTYDEDVEDDCNPHLKGSVLLTDTVIDKLNHEIGV